ncbi:DUF1499 domain-containing protein [Moritella sp. F3]|uniref:DUF1499 domain-containing protein n=1 Tax=Moritella sp. F3 TaxID=2718882 RepID=UPI0018E19D53|nr:DUF1499 domain-containing protein [Moritella sp. F3]GIC78947.1 hypothetical protein FMO001_36740 [Moritella sp. F1]GIC83530.1 hypothetical protein FMO003_38100 [Moritella sp. F3]
MLTSHKFTRSIFVLTCGLVLTACTGARPHNLGVVNSMLAPCPETPNCVSSDSLDESHYVPAFKLEASSEQVWSEIKLYLDSQSNMEIVRELKDYLYVESTSTFMRFVDDVELHLREQDGIIAVRSASRYGKSDFGVNKERIDDLYLYLSEKGLVSEAVK